jgi:hypothetical protein
MREQHGALQRKDRGEREVEDQSRRSKVKGPIPLQSAARHNTVARGPGRL